MQKPVLLLMNDVHISKENISEFQANWNEALDICQDRGISEIALGGDLFLSRVSQTLDVLLAVHDILLETAAMGIRITMAEGNHDKVNQEAIRGYCHIFDQFPGVAVVDDYLTLDDPMWDFNLHCMSYFPENGSFTEKLNALIHGSIVEGKKNFLYIHQGINGALANPAPEELPANIFSCFDKVFVGHYHNRAKINGTYIEYIGSSRQFNFGEDEVKGYTIIYADGSHEFIINKVNLRYRNLDIEAEKVDTALYDLLDELKADPRYRLKVRVHGTDATVVNVDKKRLLASGASKVEIINDDLRIIDTPEHGVLEKFDARRIRKSYGEFCRTKGIEDPSLGMDYLSKIDISCGN